MAMALGVTASAYAANPFSDVPAGHWAYDSVAKLAAAGVVDGYADGAFDGDKLMTRYEMAQIVAKAMAKGADCDKLAAEFADELDTLGVRVAKLEKGADAVKITGELRYRMYNYDENGKDSEDHKLRTRIWLKGQVNEDWAFTGMFENIQELKDDNGEDGALDLQRAYLNGKVGGLAVQAGRYSFCDFAGGLIYDHRMDGVQVAYGKDVKLTAGAGKASGGNGTAAADKAQYEAGDVAYAQLATKLGVVDAAVAYYKFDDVQKGITKYGAATDVEIITLGAAMPIAKDVKLSGYYLFNESDIDNADDGFVVGLNWKKADAKKVGTWGAWAKWYDQPEGTYVDPTWEAKEVAGWEGYGIGVDYTVAKNMVASVKYYDLDQQKGNNDAETLYAQFNVTF